MNAKYIHLYIHIHFRKQSFLAGLIFQGFLQYSAVSPCFKATYNNPGFPKSFREEVILRKIINPVIPNAPFLHPRQHQKTLRFSDVFKG